MTFGSCPFEKIAHDGAAYDGAAFSPCSPARARRGRVPARTLPPTIQRASSRRQAWQDATEKENRRALIWLALQCENRSICLRFR